jgi:hypothetical protein
MIQVEDHNEGKLEFVSGEQLYHVLGLKGEDDCEE